MNKLQKAQQMSDKPKPRTCYCGSDNLHYEFSDSQGYIVCHECGAQGPHDERAADPWCEVQPAWDAWNAYGPPRPGTLLLEQLRDRLDRAEHKRGTQRAADDIAYYNGRAEAFSEALSIIAATEQD